ncbi:MAG: nucleoside kinase, partial [Oscillospiraceae bacterium]|nr:nucleoside kinase [Oscillospiraceae bacterium]
KTDPRGFAEECEHAYNEKVARAAGLIAENLSKSPIVLLSGPSGSGKTTTAKKLSDALEARGVAAHTISLDHYFNTLDPKTAPRTPAGDIDFESPYCLDLQLLDEHFGRLARGEEILVPHFSFSLQSRDTSRAAPLRLEKDELAIFEGIHALNGMVTGPHQEAFRLYISARSDIEDGGEVMFKGTWTRLVRRAVRDSFFRGTDAPLTFSMWGNVRRGEKLHISPYKNSANYRFNSSMPYELPALKKFAAEVLSRVPCDIDRHGELCDILPSLLRFEDFAASLIPQDSILREFIGGGKYKY